MKQYLFISKFLGLIIVLFIISCDNQKKEEESFFPLDEGLKWTYRVTTNPQCCEITFSVISEGLTNFENQESNSLYYIGAECSGIIENRQCGIYVSSGREFYIKQNDGIYLIGKLNDKLETKTVYNIPLKVFHFPVEIGTSWKVYSDGTIYENDGNTILIRDGYELTIIGTLETVIVPAGEFIDNSVEIHGIEYHEILSDNNVFPSINEVDEWFVQGIGETKKIIHSSADFLGIVELLEFSRDSAVSLNNNKYSLIAVSASGNSESNLTDVIYKADSISLDKSALLGLGFPIFSLSIFF